MHRLQVLELAVGERGVEQEGFPYPGLAQEQHAGLPRFETRQERLQGRRMTPIRKERGWTRGVRERVPLQVIKMGWDHGVGHLRLRRYDAQAPPWRQHTACRAEALMLCGRKGPPRCAKPPMAPMPRASQLPQAPCSRPGAYLRRSARANAPPEAPRVAPAQSARSGRRARRRV